MARISREELLSGKIVGLHQLEEPLIGYKKIVSFHLGAALERPTIAVLEIPKGALVVRGETIINNDGVREIGAVNKLRADCVIVRKILVCGTHSNYNFYSLYDSTYIYHVKQEHRPVKEFDLSLDGPCRSGIHFFLTEREADEFRLK